MMYKWKSLRVQRRKWDAKSRASGKRRGESDKHDRVISGITSGNHRNTTYGMLCRDQDGSDLNAFDSDNISL